MKNIAILTAIAMTMSFLAKAQDIITTKKGDQISALIMEVSATDISYKTKVKGKHSSRETFTIPKSEVSDIRYKNGSKVVYDDNTTTSSEKPPVSNTNLLKRGNKVFVVAPDKGAVTHGNEELNYWGYWQVVDKKEDADIVVNYRIKRIHTYKFKGYADVEDAKTGKVILTTKKANTTWSMKGYNHKVTIVGHLTKILREEIDK